jgi:hypothetical protein
VTDCKLGGPLPSLALPRQWHALLASQPAEDGEADGATAPPTADLSSEEPLACDDGVRTSVGPPLGTQPNV